MTTPPPPDLLTNFAVCRAAHRLAAVQLVPCADACAQAVALAAAGEFDPRSIPLLPVWECDREERCGCGFREVDGEAQGGLEAR